MTTRTSSRRKENLESSLMGQAVFSQVAATHHTRGSVLRVVVMAHALSLNSKECSMKHLASALGSQYVQTTRYVVEAVDKGWLERRAIGRGIRVTLSGLSLISSIERADRAAREAIRVERDALPKRPRKYVRKIAPASC